MTFIPLSHDTMSTEERLAAHYTSLEKDLESLGLSGGKIAILITKPIPETQGVLMLPDGVAPSEIRTAFAEAISRVESPDANLSFTFCTLGKVISEKEAYARVGKVPPPKPKKKR